MKVRATQDGTYAGYYRYGPIDADTGYIPGDVFEISDEKFILKDGENQPMPVLVEKMVTQETWKPIYDKSGNPTFDKNGAPMCERDKPVMKKEMVQAMDEKGNPKWLMGSWFAPEWMEKVPDETPVTYDYPPFELPVPYRLKRKPNDMMTVGNFPIPAGAPGNMPAPRIF